LIRHRDFGELSLRREADALRRAGYEVHVVCLRDSDAKSTETASSDGIHVHMIPLQRERAGTLRYLFDYASFFLAATVLVGWLHLRHRFRVVQVNTMPDFLVFCAVVPKLLGAQVIVFMKEPTPELGLTKYGTNRWWKVLVWCEQAALRFADLGLTVTEQLKETYVRRGADPRKLGVVLNGPDSTHLQVPPAAPVVGAAARTFTLLCHGAIEERYGHETILRAVARARSEVGLRLRITGCGSYEARVAALVRELGLEEHVELLGWLTVEDLAAEISAADVGIVAQESSPYSNLVHTNKMYDYILFGKPVIATRLDAVAAYFDDESLFFVESGDVDAMARAIVALATDPRRREELTHNASKLYEAYGWTRQAEIYLDAFNRVGAT
jgi:glycosyltransferase involved in cell wall biosynthesis